MNLIGTAAKIAPEVIEVALPWLKTGGQTLATGIAAGSLASNFEALQRLVYDPSQLEKMSKPASSVKQEIKQIKQQPANQKLPVVNYLLDDGVQITELTHHTKTPSGQEEHPLRIMPLFPPDLTGDRHIISSNRLYDRYVQENPGIDEDMVITLSDYREMLATNAIRNRRFNPSQDDPEEPAAEEQKGPRVRDIIPSYVTNQNIGAVLDNAHKTMLIVNNLKKDKKSEEIKQKYAEINGYMRDNGHARYVIVYDKKSNKFTVFLLPEV